MANDIAISHAFDAIADVRFLPKVIAAVPADLRPFLKSCKNDMLLEA